MNGVIVIDKPEGISSHNACRRVKELLGAKKTGHTGTLDPMATGVLPVCVNEGTKLVQFLPEAEKEYHAVMELGRETDTHDSQGKTLTRTELSTVDLSRLESTVKGFSGEYFQVPPMYSALKHKGTPLYKLARQGKSIARPARRSEIRHIAIVQAAAPFVRLRIVCSAGTYIRTLCHDIGQALGCGAHMTELRRVRSGPFHLDSALSLDELSRLHRERGLSRHIIPPREALHNIPSAYVDTRVERKIRNGGSIRAEDCSSIHIGDEVPAGRVKIISRTHNTLVAVAELRSQRTASAVGRTGAAVPTWKTLRVFAHHSALEPESQQRCACHA